MIMPRTKSPKTNGVKEAASSPVIQQNAAPAAGTQVADTQAKEVKATPVAQAEPVTKAEAKKPKVAGSVAPKLETLRSEPRNNLVPINLEEEIRRLAYLYSERRGFKPGYENEDWLNAEHEIMQRYRQHTAQSA
jgi:hypothetical protein